MIIGQPKKLSPAFNNLYLYASSTNTTEPGFRYYTQLGKVNAQQSSIDLVSAQFIKPRFGDNNLEYNFNKTAQSLLGDLTDDIDFNDTTLSTIFYNTPSSGIDLLISVSDTYQTTWNFTGTYSTFFGQIGLSGNTEPLYQAGDQIIVQGLSSFFEYTAIVNGTLNYAEFTLTEPHNLSVGDFVLIQQDSPFTYPIYNNYFEVLFAGDPYAIGVDLAFQGTSQLPQTGRLIYNTNLDGAAIVLNAGGSFPNYFVEINRSSTGSTFGPITVSPTQSGDTRFLDNRISDFPSGVMGVTTIFNGGMDRKLWLDYTSGNYSTLIDQWKFLTSLPNQWSAKLDNDIYLNFWNYGLDYDYLNLVITTKNCSGGTIGNYILPYDGSLTATTVQSINVGPAHINEICSTIEYIFNGQFWDNSYWDISTGGNGQGTITGNTFIYSDAVEFSGTGLVLLAQNGTLTIGQEYTLTITVDNNSNVEVWTGVDGTAYQLVTTGDTGEFTYTFIANTTDFSLLFYGTSLFTNALELSNVSVTNSICDLLNCDICSYDIRLDSRAMDTRVQNIPLDIGNAYSIANFGNAYTVIDNGELQYNDLVEFGGVGSSIISQDCVFVEGRTYTLVIDISNNTGSVLVSGGAAGNPLFPFGTTGSTGTFSASFTAYNPILVILMSGYDEFGTNGATIDNIQVFLDDVFVTSSQTMSFTLDCSCEGRYTNYPIIFKDRMGSFVTFNFDLNNKQMVDINRTTYNSFVGGGPVTDLNASCLPGRFSYSLNDTGNKVFSTLIQEKWELNADAMTEEESVYFEELLTSPRAAIKIDGQYYAINIEDNTYTRVRKNNQKMIYHKLNISFANNNPIQSL